MATQNSPRKLVYEDVAYQLDVDQFGFELTSELQPLDELVGQPRALEALDMGVAFAHRDYHIYAAGIVGTGRLELLKQAVIDRNGKLKVPDDWVYVNNFREPDRPLAISLPAGHGKQLRNTMVELIETLIEALPKAFREEDFDREKKRLRQHYKQKGEEVFQQLENLAHEHRMDVRITPDGQLLFIPLKDDNTPMSPDEVQQLSPEKIEELEGHQEQLIEMAGDFLSQQREIERELKSDVRKVAESFATRLIAPLIKRIRDQFPSEKLHCWLDDLQKDLVEHLDRFREGGHGKSRAQERMLKELEEGLTGDDPQNQFLDYEVNLLIDNSETDKAPVVVEDAPHYKNLFGTVERVVDRLGRVITNFTRIKGGSLLRANGGYLVFDLIDAISEPLVWRKLKQTLKASTLEIEAYDPFSMFSTTALKPEPIPLSVKLVAVGGALVYHLLCLHDDDFSRIFRVKADFDVEIPRGKDAGQLYGQFVRKLSDREDVLPFDSQGIGQLIHLGARLASQRDKISTDFSQLADLVREADYWARKQGDAVVSADHIRIAFEKRVYRSDLVAEKIRELITDGTLLIDVGEPAVGRINGLSVANLGDYSFGRPSRLTASAGVGASGIVNIERESRLSGETFDKGLLILEGFLRNQYAQDRPLTLSAGIAMEQSYGGIDGDSASVAELLCLLSAIAVVPLRQDIAVTGSINQWGDVQAIGGINEKIEGFFDVCKELGLSGTQGVCLPASNVKNLVLRHEVVDAIRADQFHLWAIEHVDEAIELFTGIAAGDVDDGDSLHGMVADRLAEMLDTLRDQPSATFRQSLWVPGPGMPKDTPPDPRPPLPGQPKSEAPIDPPQ